MGYEVYRLWRNFMFKTKKEAVAIFYSLSFYDSFCAFIGLWGIKYGIRLECCGLFQKVSIEI